MLAAPLNASEQAGAAAFGVSYQVAAFAPASGWTNVPAGDPAAPPHAVLAERRDDVRGPEPQPGLRHLRLRQRRRRRRSRTTRSSWSHRRGQGRQRWRRRPRHRRLGRDPPHRRRRPHRRARRPDRRFYVKLIGLARRPELVQAVLHLRHACDRDLRLRRRTSRSTLVDQFPTSTAADFAPLEAGIVDEDTYVEQGLKWADFHWRAPSSTSSTTVQPDTDLLMLGNPVTDEFTHQFLGLTVPVDIDGDPNPYYDDLTNDNIPDGASPPARATSATPTTRPTRRSESRRRPDGRARRDDGLRELRPRLRAAVVRRQRRAGRWSTWASRSASRAATAGRPPTTPCPPTRPATRWSRSATPAAPPSST